MTVPRLPPVAWAAAALIVAHLAVRAVLAFGGYFYWDDLVLVARAGTQQLWSPAYLFADYDGHVMPGAFAVAWFLTRLAPLAWAGPAASLLVLTLVSALALLRALHVILGWRPALLVPLTFALFTPLGVPAFSWWAAGLNALPLTAALAWVCADALLFLRTGARRYLVSAPLVYLVGLTFFEKAAVIPFVAAAVALLAAHVQGQQPLAAVWRRGRPLWLALAALTVAWVGLYLAVVDQRRWTLDAGMTVELLLRSITHGVVPALAGGPWVWQRWAPASPWATPPVAVMLAGWVLLLAALGYSLRRRRRLIWVWVAAAGYVVAAQVPIYLMRSSQFTALELAQTLRYLPDAATVLALLIAMGYTAPQRNSPEQPARSHVVAGVCGLVTVSSLFSTATFLVSWRDNPTRDYLRHATATLGLADREFGATLLDQALDPLILSPIQFPQNLASHVFARVPERPEFTSATTDLRMFTSAGALVPAKVTWVRTVLPGPDRQCGYLVQPERPARLPLSGPLLPADWTTELNYLANTDGSLHLSLDTGPTVQVPVHPGLNRVFVRLPGAGSAIDVRANTAALSVCLASGPVGFLAPR